MAAVTPASPATELLPIPASGRRFVATRAVRLGDVDPRGLLRLDATARQLQDVAADDAADAGLDTRYGWVVRRTLVEVRRPAVLDERVRLTTFCTGIGRCWAERRTSIVGERGGSVEAVSLWVQVDGDTGRPAALDDRFFALYGEAAGGRRVSTRLALDRPDDTAEIRPWMIRAVDLDVFGHVNNASHWPVLEEAVADRSDRVGVAEMENLAPVDVDSGVALHLRAGPIPSAWLVADGKVHTAARWTPAGPDPR